MFEDEDYTGHQKEIESIIKKSKKTLLTTRILFVIFVIPLIISGFLINMLFFYPGLLALVILSVVYFTHKHIIKLYK